MILSGIKPKNTIWSEPGQETTETKGMLNK